MMLSAMMTLPDDDATTDYIDAAGNYDDDETVGNDDAVDHGNNISLGVPGAPQEVQHAGVSAPAAQGHLVLCHHPLRELPHAHKDADHGGLLQGGQGEEGGDGAEEAEIQVHQGLQEDPREGSQGGGTGGLHQEL